MDLVRIQYLNIMNVEKDKSKRLVYGDILR